jgi:hypothetical protein
MQQRDNEIATQVALEIRTEKASASAERNILGDASGEDGDIVFVQAQPELDMSHGNNSNVEREAYKSRLDWMIPEDVEQPTKSDRSGKCVASLGSAPILTCPSMSAVMAKAMTPSST